MERPDGSFERPVHLVSIPIRAGRYGAGRAVHPATADPSRRRAERPGRLPARVADFDAPDGLDGDDEVGVVEFERRARYAGCTGHFAAEEGVEGVGVYVLCERRQVRVAAGVLVHGRGDRFRDGLSTLAVVPDPCRFELVSELCVRCDDSFVPPISSVRYVVPICYISCVLSVCALDSGHLEQYCWGGKRGVKSPQGANQRLNVSSDLPCV